MSNQVLPRLILVFAKSRNEFVEVPEISTLKISRSDICDSFGIFLEILYK